MPNSTWARIYDKSYDIIMLNMTANDIFRDSRVAHVRELKTEVTRLKEELARTREELAGLKEHFALALVAARDADKLPEGGRILIVDGWNAVIGTRRLDDEERRTRRHALTESLRRQAEADPQLFVWLLFDGNELNADVQSDGRLRVGYTGGTGAHRADRMVCDYLRMLKHLGLKPPVTIFTDDKDFAHDAKALGATIQSTKALYD